MEQQYTKQELLDAYCEAWGYTDTVVGDDGVESPNPETKIAFLKRTERERSVGIAIRHLQHKREREVKEEIISRVRGVDL